MAGISTRLREFACLTELGGCGALPGERCTTRSGTPMAEVHAARWDQSHASQPAAAPPSGAHYFEVTGMTLGEATVHARDAGVPADATLTGDYADNEEGAFLRYEEKESDGVRGHD